MWRHLAGVAVLAALGVGWAAFGYLTSGQRLGTRAAQMLERFTGGDVEIAAAELDLFDGIHLSQVSVAIPEGSDFAPAGAPRARREVFLAGDLYLKVNPFRLLLGALRIDEITAVDPAFIIVRRSPQGRFNWQELFQRPFARRGSSLHPQVRLRNATVWLYRLEGGARVGTDVMTVHALARPRADDPDTYNIDLWQIGPADEAGQLAVNTRTLALRLTGGTLPEVPIASARAALPPGAEEFERWLSLLDLRGRVTGDDLVLDQATGRRQALIILRDVSLSLPLTDEESKAAPQERFVQLRSASGTLRFEGASARLRINATLRGSPCELDISATALDAAARDLADLGVAARVRVNQLEIPGDADDPNSAAGRLIARWKTLQDVFGKFDPSGTLDLEVDLVKPPGRHESLRLKSARFYARGVDATYYRFPYRIEDLRGQARLTEEGLLFENLVGRHGLGRVVVNGKMADLSPQTAFDLHFDGGGVALDDDLAAALSPHRAEMYRLFGPGGRADLGVHVWRGPPEDGRSDPTKVQIDAKLKDARGSFAHFPYSLSDVTGGLHITNDRIELRQVRGRHGDARVTLDGWVSGGGEAFDIRLRASDVGVDEALVSALPHDASTLLAGCGLEGIVDLEGRLQRAAPESALDYDLAAGLSGGRLQHEQLPYRVDGVEGLVRLRPGRVVLEDLRGGHGEAQISISGELGRQREMWIGEITLHSPNLPLDEELRGALPPQLRSLWSAVNVSGEVAVTAHLALASAAGRTVCRHFTDIQARGNTVQLAALPVTLSEVTGGITLTDQDAVFQSLQARRGPTKIGLSGRLGLGGGTVEGRFSLQVEDLVLDEALREAIPWRLRRVWNDVQPRGRADLMLTELSYAKRADGSSAWSFDGSLALREAALDVGLPARQISGSLVGGGRLARGGEELDIHGDLNVPSVELNGRRYEDVTGRLSYTDTEGVLRLAELSGRLHAGQVVGEGEASFGETGTQYDLSLLVRDISLADLLNATRPQDAEPLDAVGVVSGNLYLSGVAGDRASRRAGGEVLISQAHLFRLPLLLEVLEASQMGDAAELSGQQARVKFFVQADTLHLDRLELREESMSMLGAGTLNLDTHRLEVTLLSARPAEWPDVPLVTELLQGASRELMEVKIEGTLADPQVRGRPLPSVEAALRTLFQAGRSSDRGPLDE